MVILPSKLSRVVSYPLVFFVVWDHHFQSFFMGIPGALFSFVEELSLIVTLLSLLFFFFFLGLLVFALLFFSILSLLFFFSFSFQFFSLRYALWMFLFLFLLVLRSQFLLLQFQSFFLDSYLLIVIPDLVRSGLASVSSIYYSFSFWETFSSGCMVPFAGKTFVLIYVVTMFEILP